MDETKDLNGKYSKFLIEGEQILKVVTAKKTKAEWGSTILNPLKAIHEISSSVNAIKNNETGPAPRYPTNKRTLEKSLIRKGYLGYSCKTRAERLVLTNFRMFFITYKWADEPSTAYTTISILYNPEIKPTLVEINKGRREEIEERQAEADAGDKAAAKELKKRQGRGFKNIMFGPNHEELLEHRINALRYPSGWYEPANMEVKGSTLNLDLNWNNPIYMVNHLGAATPEEMKATMGAQFFNVKPFKLMLKLDKHDVSEIYALIRRGTNTATA
jgi:hypothetical protein